jgi:hypothetical protein
VRQVSAVATERATDIATVVIGPKTRLGGALRAASPASDRPVYAVARDERDRDELSASGASVVSAGSTGPLLGDVRPHAVRIHVCALGPVHPETAQPAQDASLVARDLALVERLLDEAAGREVHVVLVSSVLALAPGADRAYYAGWKNVVEGELADLVDQHPAARLSVLYPGRLLAAEDRRRPWHRTHTTFERLAVLMNQVGEGPGRSRIVGLDARAWLLARSASLLVAILSGSRSTRRRHGVVGATGASERSEIR